MKNAHIAATIEAARAFADEARQSHVIESIELLVDSSGYSVAMANGLNCILTPVLDNHEPEAGSLITLWGRGIGYSFRGQAVDNVVYWYRTEDEDREHRQRKREAREAEQRAEYDAAKPDHDRRIDKLPRAFQRRIDGFRDRNPDFGWQHEAYELFVIEQAVVIAEAFPSRAAISQFYELPYEEQRAFCPALSDQHSGNTFGTACLLANHYLETPETLWKAHGALCPLVGCDDYGCWSGSDEAKSGRGRLRGLGQSWRALMRGGACTVMRRLTARHPCCSTRTIARSWRSAARWPRWRVVWRDD